MRVVHRMGNVRGIDRFRRFKAGIAREPHSIRTGSFTGRPEQRRRILGCRPAHGWRGPQPPLGMHHREVGHGRQLLLRAVDAPDPKVSVAEPGPLHLTKPDLPVLVGRPRVVLRGIGPVDHLAVIDEQLDVGAILDQLQPMNRGGGGWNALFSFLHEPELVVFAEVGPPPIGLVGSIGVIGDVIRPQPVTRVPAKRAIPLGKRSIEDVLASDAAGCKKENAQAAGWIEVLGLPFRDEPVREFLRTPEDVVKLLVGRFHLHPAVAERHPPRPLHDPLRHISGGGQIVLVEQVATSRNLPGSRRSVAGQTEHDRQARDRLHGRRSRRHVPRMNHSRT